MSSSSTDTPIYVRIKRQNQVFFVSCRPSSDTAVYLKEQIAASLAGQNDETVVTPDQMRIYLPNSQEQLESLEEIKNEDELHVVFQTQQDEWEPVDVVSLQDQVMAD